MRILVSIIVAVALLVPAGCGDDADSGSEVSSGTTTSQATTAGEVAWPEERGYASLVYASGIDRVLLVGGAFGEQASALHDLWSVDLADTRWVERSGMPPGSGPVGAPVAYDTESGEVIALQAVFHDQVNDPVATWSYDPAADRWTEVSSSPQPRLGVGARMVYDSRADRLIAFGGALSDGSHTAETWAYDANTRTWEERASLEPPGVAYHALAYDEQSARTVLYGFTDAGANLLWAYDSASDAWEVLPIVGGPPSASAYQQAVYDPATDRILVFGGIRPEDPDVVPRSPHELAGHGELWRYDYDANAWEQASTNESSGPLSSHGMTITDDGTIVVFGGGPSWVDYTGDGLWTYDTTTDRWTEHAR